MTTTFIIPSILFFLAVSSWHIKAESHWTTESHAEEEEEKKPNVPLGNESFQTTFPAPDSSTKADALEKIVDIGGNALWNRGGNFSDYDELHDDGKHDASPENSVDRDSLENVNYFLQENTDVESSTHLDLKREQPTTPSSRLYLLRDENVSPTIASSDQDDRESFTSFNCAFGDRKCKSSIRIHELESKFREKLLPSVSSILPSSSLWNVVKLSKSQEHHTSERSEISSSTSSVHDIVASTASPAESSTAQTSDNLIVIEGTEVNKDELGTQSQSNKSEKFKPEKHAGSVEELTEESSVLKMTVTSTSIHTKVTPLIPDIHLLSSLLFTRILDFTSSPQSETSTTQIPSLTPSRNTQFDVKTDMYETPGYAINAKSIENIPSVDHSKAVFDVSSSLSSATATISWYTAKSDLPVSEGKPTKELTANFPDMATVISPSFRESSSSVETTSLASRTTNPPLFRKPLDPSSSTSPVPEIRTPNLETAISSPSVLQESSVLATIKEDVIPPPRLSNPSCSSLPVCVEITLLETTWEKFCTQTYEFREFLSKSVSHYTRPIYPHHIVLDAESCATGTSVRSLQTAPDITVPFYITDDSGEYEERLTEICGVILRKWAPTAFRSSVMEVRLYSNEEQSTPLPLIPELNSGFVAAVSISAVAGVALCLLCILLVIMKQKLMQGRNSDTTTPTADAYSLDSLSINASFRRRRTRRSARSYLNHAFSDQEVPSHPLNEKTLVNCLKSRDLLEEEFKKIPMNMPKLDSIPEGAHVKNRYSNILPKPESRVVLAEPSGDPFKCYINANFIKGYEGKSAFYIACQAPLPEGIEDFWRMVWEQQCRVIIMLTQFEENGVSRCALYFPQSTLVSLPPFGDYQVSLLKKDVYEFYTMSTLRLLDLEKNLFRDVMHLWFTGWPDVGVPKDPSSLITFVQQCRPYINCNSGPTVVHCSTGTGRTGVFLAMDICMREYEESRSIDVLQCVSQLRRDRGGAVQNKDQYILIYEAMLEYISQTANQSERPSICSKTS